ncbi:MAG: 5-(carboxyamino)imidazole ribonucleotide mutase [Myxococcota bacterium]|nr:5-(carboxyamino)imidazole ribonucleotide mutase [Myxococcota bacterium]
MSSSETPRVGILMGSDSDWPVMKAAAEIFREFGVPFEAKVMSAHRTPEDVAEYSRSARSRGLEVLIAGAGKAAHLAGAVAASSPLPVIGVPVPATQLDGMDALLATVQMPSGVPVATVAIGGAKNAGLLAIQMLAIADAGLADAFAGYKVKLAEASRAKRLPEL